MKLSDLKNDKPIIFRYVVTGISGLALGFAIGILIVIFFFNSRQSLDYYFWRIVPSIFGFGAAFFGIASKDVKRTIHYGVVGAALGIIMAYYFDEFRFNYYQPLAILFVWGFAIGLPRLKSAMLSGISGMVGGSIISLLVFWITHRQMDPRVSFVSIPTYMFFFFLVVGSIIGLITYIAEKYKGMKPSFSDKFLFTGTILGVGVLAIVVLILTVIAAFMASSDREPRLGIEYQIDIQSKNQTQYSIYFPFLIQDLNHSEILKNASLTGDGTYSVANTERGEALLINGKGNITFKVDHKYNKLYEEEEDYQKFDKPVFSGTTELFFQGTNNSVSVSIDGQIGDFANNFMKFDMQSTILIEGWQEIIIKQGKVFQD